MNTPRTIFRTWGDFWAKDMVDFGWTRGSPGTLLGIPANAVDSTIPVDFKEQAGVYILFNSNRDPIYVGQSGSGSQKIWYRLRAHASGRYAARWTHFTWFGFYEPNEKGLLPSQIAHSDYKKHRTEEGHEIHTTIGNALNEVEGVLIHILEPRLNKQGARLGSLKEYRQYTNDGIQLENDRIMSRILTTLEKIETKLG